MLVVDQLKQHDAPLRVLAIVVVVGMVLLLAGLWHVQVVSARKYRENLNQQSFRTVRVPGIRGKILDRNGRVLAENAARYGVHIYLEELPSHFEHEYTNRVRPAFQAAYPGIKPDRFQRVQLQREARYRVVSNLMYQASLVLQQPVTLDPARFHRHYERRLFVPLPVLPSLTPRQMARFAESLSDMPGMELEIQPGRYYPGGGLAAHVLGYVQSVDRPPGEEEFAFKYFLPDSMGMTGVERAFDAELRGRPGIKALLVNNLGYRQREEMRLESEPGMNVQLTIDARIQAAAEQGLSNAIARARGAAVVVDVRNGDILALASVPAYDPNGFVTGVSQEEMDRLLDPKQRPLFNRATHGAYPPGSILKILTGLACLESGLDPKAVLSSPGFFRDPKVSGHRSIGDTAPPGDYDFERAFLLSCNTYFIRHGVPVGLKKLLEVGHRFGLGELTGLPTRQEVSGAYPAYEDVRRTWTPGNTAHLCIGQEVTVTPIQVALMTAAIANGGTLYSPRLVARVMPMDPYADEGERVFPSGQVRRQIDLDPRHLEIIHHAMAADTESREGTGKAAAVRGWRVGGKTGTAEIKGGGIRDKCTWFASFAPLETPRYAVVVLVESGISGGGTCAPVARRIYEAIQQTEGQARASLEHFETEPDLREAVALLE